MKLSHMAVVALLFISPSASSTGEPPVSQEEVQFLKSAYSRMVTIFAEEKRTEEAKLAGLRRAEKWARQSFDDASALRKSAEGRQRTANAQDQRSGSTGSTTSSSSKAAQKELDRAASREAQARTDLVGRSTALEAAEAAAKARSEKRKEDQRQLTLLTQQFNRQPTAELAAMINDKYERLAAEYGAYVKVTWRTSPKPAALLHYQTKRSRERGETKVFSLRNPTDTEEVMLMGIYHVWSVRDGRTTSNPDRLIPLTENGTVTIVEDR